MQVQPQLEVESKPSQVCMMKLDPDSVLVIFLHTNLAWFGLCFDLRSNLHAARKLTWIYMGINLQAEFFFVFFCSGRWVGLFRCGFDGAPARTPEIGPAPLVAAPGTVPARARALSGRKRHAVLPRRG